MTAVTDWEKQQNVVLNTPILTFSSKECTFSFPPAPLSPNFTTFFFSWHHASLFTTEIRQAITVSTGNGFTRLVQAKSTRNAGTGPLNCAQPNQMCKEFAFSKTKPYGETFQPTQTKFQWKVQISHPLMHVETARGKLNKIRLSTHQYWLSISKKGQFYFPWLNIPITTRHSLSLDTMQACLSQKLTRWVKFEQSTVSLGWCQLNLTLNHRATQLLSAESHVHAIWFFYKQYKRLDHFTSHAWNSDSKCKFHQPWCMTKLTVENWPKCGYQTHTHIHFHLQ